MAHGHSLGEHIRDVTYDLSDRLIGSNLFSARHGLQKKYALGLIAVSAVAASFPTIFGLSIEAQKHAFTIDSAKTAAKIQAPFFGECLLDLQSVEDRKNLSEEQRDKLSASCGTDYSANLYDFTWSNNALKLGIENEMQILVIDRALASGAVLAMVTSGLVASGSLARIKRRKIEKWKKEIRRKKLMSQVPTIDTAGHDTVFPEDPSIPMAPLGKRIQTGPAAGGTSHSARRYR